jgi:hypothetical protein
MVLICQEFPLEDSMTIVVREKNSRVITQLKEDVTQQDFVKQVLEEKGIEVSPCAAKNLEAAITIKGETDDRKV